jgi:hypothetical protein
MRRIDTTAGGACGPIKHPNGNFQKSVRPAPREIAPKHSHTGLVDPLMDMNRSTEPRMPSIKNLAKFGNVGVLAFGSQ